MDALSTILYGHTLPNCILSTTEYFIAIIARIKLYVLCGLFFIPEKIKFFFKIRYIKINTFLFPIWCGKRE